MPDLSLDQEQEEFKGLAVLFLRSGHLVAVSVSGWLGAYPPQTNKIVN